PGSAGGTCGGASTPFTTAIRSHSPAGSYRSSASSASSRAPAAGGAAGSASARAGGSGSAAPGRTPARSRTTAAAARSSSSSAARPPAAGGPGTAVRAVPTSAAESSSGQGASGTDGSVTRLLGARAVRCSTAVRLLPPGPASSGERAAGGSGRRRGERLRPGHGYRRVGRTVPRGRVFLDGALPPCGPAVTGGVQGRGPLEAPPGASRGAGIRSGGG